MLLLFIIRTFFCKIVLVTQSAKAHIRISSSSVKNAWLLTNAGLILISKISPQNFQFVSRSWSLRSYVHMANEIHG